MGIEIKMRYQMNMRNFLQQLNKGFSPELKPVGFIVIDLNDKLYNLRASGMYTSEFILSKQIEFTNQVKLVRDSIYEEQIKGLEQQLIKIKEKYIVNLSDSDVNRKLLSIKQFENKLRIADDETLIDYVNNYRNSNIDLDVDQLNIIASELQKRGQSSYLMQLTTLMKNNHVDEPWLSDKEYIKLNSTLNRLKSKIGTSYIAVDTIINTTLGFESYDGGSVYPIGELIG